MNRFSIKQSHSKNNNNITNFYHINPFRVKRNYNTMLEQNQSAPSSITFCNKRLKINDSKLNESLIKTSKPKIPEKLLKEIERYNYQRYAFSMKTSPCSCEEYN